MSEKQWKRGDPIGYIRRDIPGFEMPPYEGERYERMVPDTLDVADRADRAIRLVTSMPDPDADYEIYQWVNLDRNPPVMRHDFNGGPVQPKFLEALPLLRHITGNRLNTEVDRVWMESVLRMQGEDGLLYMPVVGRPWARLGLPPVTSHEKWAVGDDGTSDQLACLYPNGILMGVMGLYYTQTNEAVWKEAAQRVVDRMAQLMVYKEDYCYYPILTANPGATVSPDAPMLDPECRGEGGGSVAGWIIHGLCQVYMTTGYEPALELAGKLAVYLKDYSGCYDRQARFLGMVHTHHHLKPLIGLLEYALLTDNEEMAEFVRKGYEYTRSCGSPTIGYFPGIPGPDTTYDYATIQEHFRSPSEGCSVADFIAVAIKLSQAGIGDYWDDVDRCVRNHFFESQLLSVDWVAGMTRNLPPRPVNEAIYETADRVAERNVGAFASLPAPNGLCFGFGWPGMRIMHCCTGNAIRSIYYLWDNMMRFQEGTLTVELLLNRVSPWADVDSYIPYEGKVDLRIKVPCSLKVRIPEWVRLDDTSCTVNGQTRESGWEGRYVTIGDVRPGDLATLTFPIAERTVQETIWGQGYKMVIRGNDVVHMEPPGEYYPFYQQRGHYREGQPRWIKRQRFVSPEPVRWR